MDKIELYSPVHKNGLHRQCDKCLKLKRKLHYERNKKEIVKKQKDRYKARSNVNIIDLADEILSLHGIDFLQLVKNKRKERKVKK